MQTYITQKAELTPDEAERLLPIFQEMKKKQREVMRKIQNMKQREEEKFDKDEDYQEALLKIIHLNVEAAKVEETYYKKMCKAVSAQKAYRVKRADDAFHREMLKHVDNRRHKSGKP